MRTAMQSDPSGFETLEAFSKATALNRWMYRKIRRFVQGEVLEVGSGIGNISTLLLNNHEAVFLSDLRSEYCQVLENKFSKDSHLRGIFELNLSVPDFALQYPELVNKFDTVIALNVIEHIADDSLAIRNAKSLLRNNGKLVVLVPAGQWLYNSLDKELGHFRRYSRACLNDLLKSCGLAVTDSFYFNAAAILGWWFSGKILKDKKISSSKLNVYDHLIPVFRITDWLVVPFTGISVISIGANI